MDESHRAHLDAIKQRRKMRGINTAPFEPTPSPSMEAPNPNGNTNNISYPSNALDRSPIQAIENNPSNMSAAPSPHVSPGRKASNEGNLLTQKTNDSGSGILGVYTKKNPFREQSFLQFRVNPDHTPYTPQKKVSNALVDVVKRNDVVAAAKKNVFNQPPVYLLETSIQVLKAGDWFLKWDGRKTKIHKRYFYLDQKAQTLFVSKAQRGSPLLSMAIGLAEIVHLENFILLWDEQITDVLDPSQAPRRAVPVYCARIWTSDYEMQFGTEIRDKFDLWFDALTRLTTGTRAFMQQYLGRVGPKPWDDDTTRTMENGFQINTDPTE
eukprot:PhF_6_TR31140/c0_g1_i1/m.45603